MLYVTTRNSKDAVTAYHALVENRGADGGLYVPLHLPKLTEQQLKHLCNMSYGQCIAEFLNLFCSSKLTGWDVDFAIGRYPVRIEPLAHRILMAESWHNPDGQYRRLENNLKDLLQAKTDLSGAWVSVAVRMAVMAGIFTNRDAWNTGPVDIATISGDCTLLISAWYLRKMGFPIGNIVCCCNENKQLWDLLCNGQMRTDGISISTIVPQADVTLPVNLERLIFDCGGALETNRYLECCSLGEIYSVSEPALQQLRQGMFASVVSTERVEATIPNVYKTHGYVLSPDAALAYSGLQDYRVKTGITGTAIILCDNSPVCDGEMIAQAMGISVAQLRSLF